MTATITDLLARVVWRADCAFWTGWTNDDGYGYVHSDGRDQPVHRVMYQLVKGPLAAGLEIDHVCQNRACINIDHLEAVTHAENQRRIALRQTSCRRAGHDWTDPRNVRVRADGRRYCAECDRIAQRARHARKTR
jgi:hypothetical protein